MHLSTHRLIGKWLYAQLSEEEASQLPRFTFLVGNLKPDFHRKGPGRRHVFEDTRDCLEQKLRMLQTGVFGRHAAALALGEVCHHVADTFCRYHHDLSRFPDRRRHFQYEMRLQRWFSKNYPLFDGQPEQERVSSSPAHSRQPRFPIVPQAPVGGDPSTIELMRFLSNQRRVYESQRPSFETDLRFTLANTLSLLRPMLALLADAGTLTPTCAM